MPEIDLEYGFKRPVRNSKIVREVDRVRHRELWSTVAVVLGVVAALLFHAWPNFELVKLGYEVEQRQRQLEEEFETQRYLQLELESLHAPRRVEQLATGDLRMIEPALEDVVILERFEAPRPPASTVVASR